MTSIPFRNWTCLFLLGLIFVSVCGQKTCDEIRQQNTAMFLRANGRKIPAPLKEQLITHLVEFFLPVDCVKNIDPSTNFNPSSGRDQGGPLGTLGWGGPVFTASQNSRLKRSVDDEEENVDDEMDLTRAKRSADDEVIDEEEDMEMREKRSVDDEDDFADLEDNEEFREKRSTDERDVSNNVDDSLPLEREKRFLNGMMGAPAAGTKPEVSESAQMMKTLLMIAKLQRKRALLAHRKVGGSRSFYGDRISLGNGMYGDSYPGRKKRAATSEMEENMVVSDKLLSRTKRFLFPPAGEPGEGPQMPSMMSIMMGTARDPNTGKKVEFGGDRMKRMMTSSFMASTMPADAQPPPGKDPSDMVKTMAPVWYFSRMQMAMNPQVRRYMSDPGDYPQVQTSGYVQKRQRSGYYGDAFPGKKRRKRSTDDNSDSAESFAVPLDRKKRAASESSNNDVITIGDATIPLEFFKPRERSDDIKYHRPAYQDRPYRQPAYRQPAYRQPVYQQPRPQYYHGNYVQSPRYSAQQYNWHQEARDRQTSQKLYQFIKALYDRQQYEKYLARTRSYQQANTLPQTQWNQQATQYALPTSPQVALPAPQVPVPQQYPPAPPTLLPPPPNQLLQSAPRPSAPLPPAPMASAPMAPAPMAPAAPVPGVPAPMAQAPLAGQPSNTLDPFAPPPNQAFSSPQMAPFLDPFLPPAPPRGAFPPQSPAPRRVKRSDNKDKKEPRQNDFFYNSFMPRFYTPYIPPRYSPYSNKIGYVSRRGGIVYGDRLPWAPRGSSGPRASLRRSPRTRHLGTARSAQRSLAVQQRVPAGRAGARRRVKRSDNKDKKDNSNNFLFPPPLFQSVYSPYRNYVPPRYSGRPDKLGYKSRAGRVVYGDRLPWAPRSNPVLPRRSRLSNKVSTVQRSRAPVNWYNSRPAPRLSPRLAPAPMAPASRVPAPRVPAPAPRVPAPGRPNPPSLITSPSAKRYSQTG